eukprot:TRINITY_DN24122_c0_g1_i1.p1 TRINITY_DN24122_c0_g1~~TRINITY_DN24122_c0_g1_i1.p1  ORF type:complete len:160 (-),score=28.85 TRINITY_DN24122_c0_g1_i1:35-481(-)
MCIRDSINAEYMGIKSQITKQSYCSGGLINISERVTMGNFITTYQLEEKVKIDYDAFLGRGAYGKVYRGLLKSTNEEVAIKFVEAEFITQLGSVEKRTPMEIMIHRSIQHPNVVRMIDGWRKEEGSFVILTEYCNCLLYTSPSPRDQA